ncbi:MAG TPA: glycoside hydrolase family 2 TIM barrel-domain containing protein [Tepidisphaeraceae bacterium]|jgi:hypothetical protein|nr:glycoside hydrolase family 2 TIM barrel-domain containing protein [Tepidisphaeraceae bacterium]
MRFLLSALAVTLGVMSVGSLADAPSGYQLSAIPEGYHLQSYDDCGVPERQPHVHAKDIYTFGGDVHGDEKARTVAWAEKKIEVDFDRLDSGKPYVIAVTYANEAANNRVQSIWAGSIQLQSPHALPKDKSERLFFTIPPETIHDGKLHLEFRLEAQVNVVVSIVELWSTDPSPKILRLSKVGGMMSDLQGRVMDLAYDGLPGADVELRRQGESKPLATTRTDSQGKFRFPRRMFEQIDRSAKLLVTATHDNITSEQTVNAADLFFDPIRYRPLPSIVDGLQTPQQSLNGIWRINLNSSDETRSEAIDAADWHDIQVPGQWIEQGFNVPEDKAALMSREFTVPAEWKGRRIILRFDSIHAGTQYWVNGKMLGSSENLFTPVEWDITDFARIGQTNRLDLKMIVATASERLSSSSSYTGHSLGGIDRSVKIFALPDIHIATMHLDAGLDDHYRNGNLQIDLGLANTEAAPRQNLSILVQIEDADGKPVHHSAEIPTAIDLKPGSTDLHIQSSVPNPLQWNAEQPNLYKLKLDLRDGDKLMERVERNIGFRRIEWKNSQLYVNGARIKLAGVARHEVDPLTGRADTARHGEEDVRLFKSANLNYIRTSHYPPTEEFLDAADRLGMYVECEAPFCWVAPAADLTDIKALLTPTSARIDFCHTHPSIIVWSIANESYWSDIFDIANKLTKSLDPSRPTTFNHPFANENGENCDIVNRHYLSMPFEDAVMGDTRPFLHGECFFEVYHERTDVGIDPGLRELWAHGSADPNSDFGKACIENWKVPGIHPGIYPGAWSYIVASKRFIGSVIWSGVDDQMFTVSGQKYSSESGNAYWGLIDGWRRPKPELWLAKLVFSPVWFPVRQFDWTRDMSTVRIPVENRYSFTNLSRLKFTWEFAGQTGSLNSDIAPGTKGEILLPVPKDAKAGDGVVLKVSDNAGMLVNTVMIHLGKPAPEKLPVPTAGAPSEKEDGNKMIIQGDRFAFVIDKTSGDFDLTDPRQHAPVTHFPRLHMTRFDFGDLSPNALPYAVLPAENTRVIDNVSAEAKDAAIAITTQDHYENFAGAVTWVIDRNGVGRVSYDYTYTGPDVPIRELGVRLAVKRDCDELHWRRWSEWDLFPEDHISRSAGVARAMRDSKWGPANSPENVRPTWPWSLNQTELGTNDFRSIKFNVYDAKLLTPNKDGVEVRALADAHVRACLAPGGVLLHVLSRCTLAPTTVKKGDHLAGEYSISLTMPVDR